MAKNTKESREARQPEDTQRIYAHAYAARLAKQVAEELESSHRNRCTVSNGMGSRQG